MMEARARFKERIEGATDGFDDGERRPGTQKLDETRKQIPPESLQKEHSPADTLILAQ